MSDRPLASLMDTLRNRYNDPKRARFQRSTYEGFCPRCHGKSDTFHAWNCPEAKESDLRHHCERLTRQDAYSAKKADDWLLECRRLYASLAAAKQELKQLRRKAVAR